MTLSNPTPARRAFWVGALLMILSGAIIVLVVGATLWTARDAGAYRGPSEWQVGDYNLCDSLFFEDGLGGREECFPPEWDAMTHAERLAWLNGGR